MVNNGVMATPISQLINNKKEPDVKENFQPFNHQIKKKTKPSIENHLSMLEGGSRRINFEPRSDTNSMNNRILDFNIDSYRNSFNGKNNNLFKKEVIVKQERKPEIIVKKGNNFFKKIKDMFLIICIYIFIGQRRLSYLIKLYFPIFRRNTSSLPLLSLKGFLFGLIYMAIKKFISSNN